MNPTLKSVPAGRMVRRQRLAWTIVACGALVLPLVPGISMVRGAGLRDSGPIVVGTSLPMTGPLGVFGPILRVGYQQAVDEVNRDGGLNVGGSKRRIALHLLDNQSNPNLASAQARTLILRDNAVALLGSATPPLNIPLSVVADQLKRPLVTSFAPIRAWLSGRPSGWRYGWDTFPDEVHQCDVFYQAANLARTNHRVALFTDTEQDGIVMGGLCPQRAPKFGYKIAYHASFAVGTTNFSSQIAAAQAAHAQVLIAQITPPDAITLWKQIKALSYRPLIALCAKGADTGGWRRGIGKLAEGTMTGDFWSPSMGFPQSRRFVARYAKQLGGITPDLSAIVAAYSVARVLFDALVAARSKDPMAINTALARTHKTYPLGPIAFGPDHTHPLLWVIDQWQGANTVRVFPTGKGAARIEVPPPGLR
ncbi:MAG: ABC transporter substrate-binding protein [Ktedonobacterales bacterium]